MPTTRIAPPPRLCRHPDHAPPAHMAYRPGTYRHVCPGCGAERTFAVDGWTVLARPDRAPRAFFSAVGRA